MEQFTFAPATRKGVRLKIGISGPSGSGKTLGALALGTALAPTGRVALIDTENGSASLYADRFQFDTLSLRPPYESKRYIYALAAAVQAGYEVVILDSMSHQWAGEGGILSRKEQVDARGGNHFSNWAPFTREHEWFKAKLLNAPVHIIATMRAKQEYALEESSEGRKSTKVRKLGLAPVQREGMEYEFSVSFELQMDHQASASKDRTGLFDGRLVDLTDATVARELLAWRESGGDEADVGAQPFTADDDPQTAARATRERARALNARLGATASNGAGAPPETINTEEAAS